ncbi:alpha/beta fold hydrolase [Streptomyces sp. NPDC000851]
MSAYSTIETLTVSAGNGIVYAYRSLGSGTDALPLVLLQHFRGNLDNWDPALIDAPAQERRVITFDNTGVGATSGRTPNTVAAMADDAITFIDVLGLDKVDLLGFSLGSFVAQEIALHRPDLVNRIVLASAGPRGAAGIHGWRADVIAAVGGREPIRGGLPGGLLHRRLRRAGSGPGPPGPHLHGADRETRRAHELAHPPRPVRRGGRVGHPGPRRARAAAGHHAAGVRRQR